MVGESISDAAALKVADVGIAMKSGCDVAKDNADIVLLKNDFKQIRTALMWGRALYKNIERFLAFQLTVNISITVITLLGCIIGHPPLNVIQMLWANLVMDILAAISLSTEAWEDNNSEGGLNKRQSRKAKLINPRIWAIILPQAAYQIVVMIVLMFFSGLFMFEKPVNLIYTPLRIDNIATDRLRMDTFAFHCFILMNLFNSFNARVIDPDNLNIFHNIL
jgi:Ca2+-transporting ATPase